MAIIATDILIKTMIEAAVADLKKNSWILDDVFGGLATDPLSSQEYGYKEVYKAKKWFLENEINIYLHNRIDNPTFPCITIVQSQSAEMIERASLGDERGSYPIEQVRPGGRSIQPQIVVGPFNPIAYQPTSTIKNQAIVTMPTEFNTTQVVPGQFLVSIVSGKAYEILQVTGSNSFTIASGVMDDFSGAYVTPPTSLWNLNRELTFFN